MLSVWEFLLWRILTYLHIRNSYTGNQRPSFVIRLNWRKWKNTSSRWVSARNWYHGCWCLGDARYQGISSHDCWSSLSGIFWSIPGLAWHFLESTTTRDSFMSTITSSIKLGYVWSFKLYPLLCNASNQISWYLSVKRLWDHCVWKHFLRYWRSYGVNFVAPCLHICILHLLLSVQDPATLGMCLYVLHNVWAVLGSYWIISNISKCFTYIYYI